MPSVLIETGFMSNSDEEAYLLSSTGQQQLANSILKAFNNYYKLLGGNGPVIAAKTTATPLPAAPARMAPTSASVPAPATRTATVYNREVKVATTTNPAPAARTTQWTAKGVDPQPISYQPVLPPANTSLPQPSTYGTPLPVSSSPLPQRSAASKSYESLLSREVSNGLRTQPSVYERSRPAQSAAAIPTDTVPRNTYTFNDAEARKPVAPEGVIDLNSIPDEKLSYAVQLIATQKELNLSEPLWQRVPYPIVKVREGEWNKYQVRNLANAAAADAAKLRIQQAGIRDAMIVVYYQNKRLGPAQVKYLLSR